MCHKKIWRSNDFSFVQNHQQNYLWSCSCSSNPFYMCFISAQAFTLQQYFVIIIAAVLHLHSMKMTELDGSISAQKFPTVDMLQMTQCLRGDTPNSATPISSYFTLGREEWELKSVTFWRQKLRWRILRYPGRSVFISLVAQSCGTLCDPMNCSTPGLPVHQQLPESTQTHVHWVSDAIQPSHPLLSPSPPTFNLYQHQGLFKWVSSLHQMAKGLEFQLKQSSQWTPRTGLL